MNVDDPYGARLAAELREAAAAPLLTFSPRAARRPTSAPLDVDFDASRVARFAALGPDGEVAVAHAAARATSTSRTRSRRSRPATRSACRSRPRPRRSPTRTGCPGRFEPVDEGQPFAVLVDYAHTPDSLDNVLRAARRLTEGQADRVFGCGGDRDREKRPLMGEIAARLADVCVVTSDNPRSEDPEAIIDEILAGIDRIGEGVGVEPDRRAAIALALGGGRPGDTVVIAGKGHEQGQEFERGRKIPFDDREVAAEELRRLSAAR